MNTIFSEDILKKLAQRLRFHILEMTTKAGSGHLTSSLSAVELMTTLMFGGHFRYFIDNPAHPNNDRLIFSKGHASPLFYSLWAVAGAIMPQELLTFREFGSRLEGHPSMEFPFTEAPTGSLGQGLSIGVGMALNAKYLDKLPYRTFVLLGDSEMAEGSNWEALQLAAYYKLHTITGMLDVNRLGQRGETMHGYDVANYKQKFESFGWEAVIVDGHDMWQIHEALSQAEHSIKPFMIIAHTVKGKGISFIENKNGWHGKVLTQNEYTNALNELRDVDINMYGNVLQPEDLHPHVPFEKHIATVYHEYGNACATRMAFGHALIELYPQNKDMIVLDAEVGNSTHAEEFSLTYQERFFEMFIAEQNMVGVAVGCALRGKIPFISSFGAFLTRAHDQFRMAQYTGVNLNVVGSHCGVSIGEDGFSQMALDDIAMFRSLMHSVVVYPADHVAAEKLTREMIKHKGISYMRTTRADTEALYSPNEEFPIGGCKVLRTSEKDVATVVAAGITVFEALQAYEDLLGEGISVRVIDLYSIKPLDVVTLMQAIRDTQIIITVEDHYQEGGIGEAVAQALAHDLGKTGGSLYSLSVKKIPRSGKPYELIEYEEISTTAIISKIKNVIYGASK